MHFIMNVKAILTKDVVTKIQNLISRTEADGSSAFSSNEVKEQAKEILQTACDVAGIKNNSGGDYQITAKTADWVASEILNAMGIESWRHRPRSNGDRASLIKEAQGFDFSTMINSDTADTAAAVTSTEANNEEDEDSTQEESSNDNFVNVDELF